MSQFRRQLNSSGYADLGIIDPTKSTLEIATNVASVISSIVSGSVERLGVTHLGVKPRNTYGGNYGLGELPLHTDLAHWYRPPRYVLLRCVTGFSAVSTRVLDRYDLQRYVSPMLMRRALFSPRRPLDGKLFLLRTLTPEAIRWDNLFLTPKNAAAKELVEMMTGIASHVPLHNIILAEPGSTLLLDNWRVLHSRSPVPENSLRRLLDRVYLDLMEHGDKEPP